MSYLMLSCHFWFDDSFVLNFRHRQGIGIMTELSQILFTNNACKSIIRNVFVWLMLKPDDVVIPDAAGSRISIRPVITSVVIRVSDTLRWVCNYSAIWDECWKMTYKWKWSASHLVVTEPCSGQLAALTSVHFMKTRRAGESNQTQSGGWEKLSAETMMGVWSTCKSN